MTISTKTADESAQLTSAVAALSTCISALQANITALNADGGSQAIALLQATVVGLQGFKTQISAMEGGIQDAIGQN